MHAPGTRSLNAPLESPPKTAFSADHDDHSRSALSPEAVPPPATETPLFYRQHIPTSKTELLIQLPDFGALSLPTDFLHVSPDALAEALRTFFARLPPDTQQKLWEKHFGFPGKEAGGLHNGAGVAYALLTGSRMFTDRLVTGKLEKNFQEEEKVASILDRFFYRAETEKNLRVARKNAKMRPLPAGLGTHVLSEPEWTKMPRISDGDVTRFGLEADNSEESAVEDSQEELPNGTPASGTPEKTSKIKESEVPIRVAKPLGSTSELTTFRDQELERYANPTQPYTYRLPTGELRWVAPVCKKVLDVSVRPRDHFLLISDRPSAVTILSLVRDAAAKLPKGYGTRGDICDLLRESQFINQQVDDERMSSVVSGALDRLHYETDPCVRFDIGRKLWIYLHWPNETQMPKGELPDAPPASDALPRSKKVKTN